MFYGLVRVSTCEDLSIKNLMDNLMFEGIKSRIIGLEAV